MGSCRFLAGCRAGSKRELLRCDLPRAEEEVTMTTTFCCPACNDGLFAKVGGIPVPPWGALDAAIGLAEAWRVSVDDARHQLVSNGQRLLRVIPGLRPEG